MWGSHTSSPPVRGFLLCFLSSLDALGPWAATPGKLGPGRLLSVHSAVTVSFCPPCMLPQGQATLCVDSLFCVPLSLLEWAAPHPFTPQKPTSSLQGFEVFIRPRKAPPVQGGARQAPVCPTGWEEKHHGQWQRRHQDPPISCGHSWTSAGPGHCSLLSQCWDFKVADFSHVLHLAGLVPTVSALAHSQLPRNHDLHSK